MQLTISNSEWNVLSKLLINSGVNSFNVNQIIFEHKKNKIIKFENQKEIEIEEKFKNRWFEAIQRIEAKYN